jgi:hypothetical protein
MKYSKIRKLLIEQSAPSSTTNMQGAIDEIKKFIENANKIGDNYRKELKDKPNDPLSQKFFKKAEKLLTDFQNIKDPYSASPSISRDEIVKTLIAFQTAIYNANSNVYNSDFKNIFDELKLTTPTEAPVVETNRTEAEVKADLDAAIKSGDQEKANKLFDELAAVRKKADPSYEPTDLLKKYPSPEDFSKSPATAIPSTATAATAGTPTKGEYATGYAGVSIVDFLDQSGKPSDFASRKELATKMGIPEYRGTASQNLLMLNALRGGQTKVPIQPAQKLQPEDKPLSSVPSIKFGDMKFPPYVDMGGGRYVRATPEQIADPNLQLYIQNPKKGAGEYNKANFVKVRREKGGQEIRRQSQFGGAVGSASNLLGDIGNTLSKPFRK